MALLPAVINPKTSEILGEMLAEGHTPAAIAAKLEPADKKARKALRKRLWRMASSDEHMAQAIVARARAQMMVGLGPATEALTRRAEKGNVPAIKLLYEASGLHNPRVKHEHSGDIKITLDMPRPNFADEGHITDAEVVDEPAED